MRAGWQKLHIEKLAEIEKPAGPKPRQTMPQSPIDQIWPRAAKRWAASLSGTPCCRDAPTKLKPGYRAEGLSSAGRRRAAAGCKSGCDCGKRPDLTERKCARGLEAADVHDRSNTDRWPARLSVLSADVRQGIVRQLP